MSKMTQVLNLIILTLMFSWMYTHPISEFSKTNIITDTCAKDGLLLTTARSRIDCGATCSADPECRRHVFCSSDSTCKLYQHGTDCILAVAGDSSSCICYRKNIGRNSDNTTTCPIGHYGDHCQSVVHDCEEAFSRDIQSNFDSKFVLTYIKPVRSPAPFEVKCELHAGGKTEILHRTSTCSSANFNRSMVEYEQGFGNIFRNHWIGFNNLVDILQSSSVTFRLRVALLRLGSNWCDIHYDGFYIDKTSGYSFSFNSTHSRLPSCGDSMAGSLNLVGNRFSTYDNDYTGVHQCAKRLGGGWWFDDSPNCTRSFLTGFLNGSMSDMFWKDNLDGKFLYKAILTLHKD